MANEWKGVRLWQKAPGGTWYAYWRDPRASQRQRNDSTETADFNDAKRVAMSLSRIIRNPDYWETPPDDTNVRAEKIWGAMSLGRKIKRASEAIEVLQERTGLQDEWYMRVAKIVSQKYFGGRKILADPKAESDAAKKVIEGHEAVVRERDMLRIEVRRLTGLLKKVDSKILVNSEPKSYADAVTAFFDSATATDASGQWREILKLWIDRFGKAYGMQKDVNKVQPDAVIEHVTGLTLRNGKAVKSGTKLKLLNNLCLFLTSATNGGFDAAAVKAAVLPTLEKQAEKEPDDWFWLTREQALGTIKALGMAPDGQYWADVAMIQYACGFRPEEMPLLQREKVKVTNGVTVIEIDRIFDGDDQQQRKLKTTRSKDRVQVPAFAMEALQRRQAAGKFLLFPMYDDALLPPIMRKRSKFEKAKALWPTADAHQFSNCYRPRLRAAALAFDPLIEVRKVDSRTLRRTCARELILRHGYERAAAVLRDSVDTLRAHYADLEASDVSTER